MNDLFGRPPIVNSWPGLRRQRLVPTGQAPGAVDSCGHTPAMKARDMLPYYGTAIPSTCGLGSMISAGRRGGATKPAALDPCFRFRRHEAPPEKKSTSGAEPSKADGGELAAASPYGYSRGEGQKPVSKAYRDNWNVIFAKKKKR
jgi:hypothetical protein